MTEESGGGAKVDCHFYQLLPLRAKDVRQASTLIITYKMS